MASLKPNTGKILYNQRQKKKKEKTHEKVWVCKSYPKNVNKGIGIVAIIAFILLIIVIAIFSSDFNNSLDESDNPISTILGGTIGISILIVIGGLGIIVVFILFIIYAIGQAKCSKWIEKMPTNEELMLDEEE